MRLVVFSQTGYSLGVMPYLSSEGHSVSALTQGVFNSELPKADVAVFDGNPVYNTIANQMMSNGTKVVGMSSWINLVDTNQKYKSDLIQAIGYKPGRGDQAGTKCIITSWFNGQRFIAKYLVFNYTKMMNEDIGASVESSGYVACFDTSKSKLVSDILTPLEKFLRKVNHRGCFSVECLANTEGVFVTDISPSFHKPYTQAIFENSRRNKSDIILDLFNEASSEIHPLSPYVCGVLLSMYPYPYCPPVAMQGITGLSDFNIRHMWLMDAVKKDNGWACGGLSGGIGYVTARGVDVIEARRRAYRTISNLSADNLQYRTDIGKNVSVKVEELRKLKLI